ERYFPATLETYAATAWICEAESCDANDGIAPFPCVTRSTTSASGGFAWSRFGPTVPPEPAASSVWQPPQPALANTPVPAAAADPPAAPVWVPTVTVFVFAPPVDRPRKKPAAP